MNKEQLEIIIISLEDRIKAARVRFKAEHGREYDMPYCSMSETLEKLRGQLERMESIEDDN